MWWLLVPVVAYAGKKIIEAIDDSSSSSSGSSSSYSKLPSQKEKRTNVRKTAINQLLSRHRNRINAQLTGIIKKESFYIGDIAIDSSNETTYKVKFTDLDKAISCLDMANNIFHGKDIARSNNIPSCVITLKSNSSLIDEIVQKADSDYGSLAGIDSYDDYVEYKDPFLDALKKVSV